MPGFTVSPDVMPLVLGIIMSLSVFEGDKAFVILPNLIHSNSQKYLSITKIAFNYRLSRAKYYVDVHSEFSIINGIYFIDEFM